jgi:hypothetical protein
MQSNAVVLMMVCKIWFLVIALRSQTPKHIRGGWSHYTDTSEPVDGKIWSLPNPGSNQRPKFDHWPTSLPTALTGPKLVVVIIQIMMVVFVVVR